MPKAITAAQLVAYFQRAVTEGWGYVWSLNGVLYTQALAQKYHATQRATSTHRDPKTYWLQDCAKWIGKMAADCSGGIIGAHRTGDPDYSDRTANTFFNQCTESGPIETLPEIPGLCLWKPGHIEIYEGNGYAIGFRGTDYGATRSKVSSRDFTHWGKLRDVDYTNAGIPNVPTDPTEPEPLVLDIQSPLKRGPGIHKFQEAFNAGGYSCGTVDGICGQNTVAAAQAFAGAHMPVAAMELPGSIAVTVNVGGTVYTGEIKK
ncbi:MAG: hypothetical protein VB049_07185 [Candidatus Pelethousia sp.]|nr:hypothetical protein [Candidatus Pelethousia sp.]